MFLKPEDKAADGDADCCHPYEHSMGGDYIDQRHEDTTNPAYEEDCAGDAVVSFVLHIF